MARQRPSGVDGCLFAVQVEDPSLRDRVQERVAALARFYAPLGAGEPVLEWHEELRLAVGLVPFAAEGDPPAAGERLWVWGEPLPPELANADTLAGASEAALRGVDGVTAAVAVAGGRARIVSGVGGPTTLYASASPALHAWSSHAVAAAWLATGAARVDPAAVPELIACEFVGDQRCLIGGVTAVPPGLAVDVTRGGPGLVPFWPASARWAPVVPERAQRTAEEALAATLARRAGSAERVLCGLTAGLDSRVAAVALREAGIGFEAFTWGEDELPDVIEARRVASALGVGHRHAPPESIDEAAGLRAIDSDARWNEGAGPAHGFARLRWPPGTGAFVTGGGGELARCFYYRLVARNRRDPGTGQLARVLRLDQRIAGADEEARRRVRARIAFWISDAEAAGHTGWSALDVVYGEQRVRRWGRAMLARAAPTLPAFSTPEVARALVSLPLEERLSDGFHRRYLEAREPGMVPPPPPGQRRGVPGVLRRAAGGLRGARTRSDDTPWPFTPLWEGRPRIRAWLADEVLRSPLLTEAMGERWPAAIRADLLRDRAAAVDAARLAAGPVALDTALRELR